MTISERIDEILTSQGLDLKSFDLHDDLNRQVWNDDDRLYPLIRKRLIEIADDFLQTLKLDDVLDTRNIRGAKDFVKDVLLLGSIASFNYSSYSDFDLHVLVDTSILDLDPPQSELLKQYFMLKKNEWNATHTDLTIKGYDVELYVQDVKDENAANGVYSVLRDKWLKYPKDMEQLGFDDTAVKTKSLWYISRIDTLESMLQNDPTLADRIGTICKTIKDRIVQGRRTSLNGDDKNEMATPNLVFKVLRRTGHLEKLTDLMVKSYDLDMSINESEEVFKPGNRVQVRKGIRCRQSGHCGVIVPCEPEWDEYTGHGDKLYHVKFDDPDLHIMGFVEQDLIPLVDECDCGAVNSVATLGGDGFGAGKPALTKGDYHLPAVLTRKPMKRKLSENTKITLTIGQLRRLSRYFK